MTTEEALEIGPGMGFGAFPYAGLGGRLVFLWERATLRLLGRAAFASVSILPLVEKVEGIRGERQLLERYEASRHGVQELWASKSRTSTETAEGFYDEHDADLWRQAYRSHFSRHYRAKLLLQARIVRMLAGRQSPTGWAELKLLDYGCGAGVLANQLLHQGFANVHLADIPSPTFRFVQAAFEDRVRGYHTVGAGRPLDDSFDLITCLDCLEHTVDPLRIAQELIASLNPGGHLVVSYPLETDFSFSHTREAAAARPEVMALLEDELEPVLPQRIFRKATG